MSAESSLSTTVQSARGSACVAEVFRAAFLPIRIRRFGIGALISFFLFWFLYGVQPTFLPTYTSRVIAIVACGFFASWILVHRKVPLPVAGASSTLLYLALLSWAALSTFASGAADVTILASILLLLLQSFLGSLLFAYLFRAQHLGFRQVIVLIQVATVAQAFFIVLFFLSRDFRELSALYIPQTGNIGDLKLDPEQTLLRSKGLTHSAGATLSVAQSLGLLFTSYLLSTVRSRGELCYLVLSFALLLLSIFLSGRTGLLMIPVILVYFGLVIWFRGSIPKSIIYSALLAPLVAIGAFIFLKFLYHQVFGGWSTSWGEDGFDRMVRWVVQEFVSDGGVRVSTAEKLIERHWFAPSDIYTWVMGNPSTWSVHRISSDVGVVRILFGLGFVGALLFYSLYLCVFSRLLGRAVGIEQWSMLLLMSLFLLIIELKEPFLMNPGVNAFVFILFARAIVLRKLHRPPSQKAVLAFYGGSQIEKQCRLG